MASAHHTPGARQCGSNSSFFRVARHILICISIALGLLPALRADTVNLISHTGDQWDYELVIARARMNATLTFSGLQGVTDAYVDAQNPNSAEWQLTSLSPTTVVFERVSGVGTTESPFLIFRIISTAAAGVVDWATTATTVGTPKTGTVIGPATTQFSAVVTTHDNWLSFGDNPATAPDEGFFAADGSYASPSYVMPLRVPADGWAPESDVPGANGYDIAGLEIHTGRRLAITLTVGGPLTRVTPAGGAFAGLDTRKTEVFGGASGPYQLASQWKIKLRGLWLSDLTPTTFVSPSSGQPTALNSWTQWGASSDDPSADTGWLWPTGTSAWTGTGITTGVVVTGFSAFVERNQGADTGNSPAELWITERVARRGLQDVAGNYRQDIFVTLVLAE